MTEEKMKTTLEKIEGLIVDGQKEVLEKLQNVEGRLQGVESEVKEIGQGMHNLETQIKSVHTSLKNEIIATANALDWKIGETKKELGEKIDRVESKLDEHMRQPAHAGV